MPTRPARVADVGAGTGRDAAWLADRGHRVLAIEPVAALREPGRALHRCERIVWLNDRLPELARVPAGEVFDLVLLCAVWQHLGDAARSRAMPRLAELTAPGGMAILSLRHGPDAVGRRVHPIDPDVTIAQARRAGFDVVRRVDADSVQAENRANGVRWTWLALKRS